MKYVYLLLMVLGTVVPWYFFGQALFVEGLSFSEFVASWSTTNGAKGALADLTFTGIAAVIFAIVDAQRNNIKRWWLMLPAIFLVGFSLAIPMYLYIRETQMEAREAAH